MSTAPQQLARDCHVSGLCVCRIRPLAPPSFTVKGVIHPGPGETGGAGNGFAQSMTSPGTWARDPLDIRQALYYESDATFSPHRRSPATPRAMFHVKHCRLCADAEAQTRSSEGAGPSCCFAGKPGCFLRASAGASGRRRAERRDRYPVRGHGSRRKTLLQQLGSCPSTPVPSYVL